MNLEKTGCPRHPGARQPAAGAARPVRGPDCDRHCGQSGCVGLTYPRLSHRGHSPEHARFEEVAYTVDLRKATIPRRA